MRRTPKYLGAALAVVAASAAPRPQAVLTVVDDRGAPLPAAWAEVEIQVRGAGPLARVGERLTADAGGNVRLPWLAPANVFVLIGAPGRAYERMPLADVDGSTVRLAAAATLKIRVVDVADERPIPGVLVWPQELSARHAVTTDRDGAVMLVGLTERAVATSVVCVGSASHVVVRPRSDRRGAERTLRCEAVQPRRIRIVGMAAEQAPAREALRLNQEGRTSECGVDVRDGEAVVDAPFAYGLLAIEGSTVARFVVDVETDHAAPQTVERADRCVGRVTVAGAATAGLLVTALGDDGLLAWTTTDARGGFQLALPPGVGCIGVSGGTSASTVVAVPAPSAAGPRNAQIDIAPGRAARLAFRGVERVEGGSVTLWRRDDADWRFVCVRQLAGLRELRFGGLSPGGYRVVGDVDGRGFETEFTVPATGDVRAGIVLAPR